MKSDRRTKFVVRYSPIGSLVAHLSGKYEHKVDA